MGKLNLYTNSSFDELRLRQDKLADQAISKLIMNPEWITLINSWEIIPDELPLDFSSEVRDFFNFFQEKDSAFEAIT